MKIAQTAWRNLWRSRGRTLLSVTAIAVSTMIVCFVIGFEEGFISDMRTNVTYNLTGDVRVMDRRFVDNERVAPLQFFVEDTEELASVLGTHPRVTLVTPRSDFGVSIYRGGEQIPARVIGLDFTASRTINRENTHLVSGRMPEEGRAEVLVSTGTARELSLEAGDRITALTRTAIGGSNGRSFTVSGVISLADADLQNRLVLMDWRLAGEYLRMGPNALQLQVFVREGAGSDLSALPQELRSLAQAAGFDSTELDIRSWDTVNSMYSFFKMAEVIYLFISSIFFLLASTVIFNTTMMSVLERRKEIGTLAALGMEKGRLHRLFLTESFWIALLGAAAGGLAGYLSVRFFGVIGFDFAAMGGGSISGFSASQVIYPHLSLPRLASLMALGIVIALAACWVPARMATRVEPAEALREK